LGKVGDEIGRTEPVVGMRFPGIGGGLDIISDFTGIMADGINSIVDIIIIVKIKLSLFINITFNSIVILLCKETTRK
jgi:hypothetical protein